MPKKDTPVACTLPEPAQRARRDGIDRTLAREIAEIRELSDGYALRFEPRPGLVEDLGRFIDAERLCCAFLDFSLRVRGAGPVWLELTGSGEAKSFLKKQVDSC